MEYVLRNGVINLFLPAFLFLPKFSPPNVGETTSFLSSPFPSQKKQPWYGSKSYHADPAEPSWPLLVGGSEHPSGYATYCIFTKS
jgi:hypothetical protein